MKLTLEFDSADPKDASLMDSVVAILSGGQAAPAAPAKTDKAAGKSESADEPTGGADEPTGGEDEPRTYGNASADRARRTKAEMAEDTEIEELAEKIGMKKIPTDVPAAELLDDLRAKAEKVEDDDGDDGDGDNFDLGGDDDGEEEVMPLEDFRAEVIKANKKHGKDAVAILTKYGKGIAEIPEGKRREVLAKLADLD